MNILFIIIDDTHEDQYEILYVPYELVKKYDLNEMNGVILNHNNEDVSIKITNQIEDIFKRIGLEDSDNYPDLKQYLNPKPPFRVDKIVVIGWML